MKVPIVSFFMALGLLFGMESFLFLMEPKSKQKLLSDHPDWRVASSPQLILKSTKGKGLMALGSYLPLGSLPDNPTLFCRESGPWITFHADEYGFRNPEKKWQSSYDYIVVGDSFAQGACVNEGNSWSGLLRGENFDVLNIASYSSGPLSQLLTLKATLALTQARHVLWFYVPNDLVQDLSFEWQQPIFRRRLASLGANEEGGDETLETSDRCFFQFSKEDGQDP